MIEDYADLGRILSAKIKSWYKEPMLKYICKYYNEHPEAGKPRLESLRLSLKRGEQKDLCIVAELTVRKVFLFETHIIQAEIDLVSGGEINVT